MTGDKSRAQLAKFAMRMDAGDYFTKNGKMDSNLGLDYFKTDKWELDPLKKGPPPKGANFANGPSKTFKDEIYSIDGEKYPC